jgi:hypothetical protein
LAYSNQMWHILPDAARVSLTFACAVKRRWFTVGESPTRELVRSTR